LLSLPTLPVSTSPLPDKDESLLIGGKLLGGDKFDFESRKRGLIQVKLVLERTVGDASSAL
jgi:hypothetical protein